ncbi:MAG: hypothetical protein EOO24_55750, partial [Comamonadaceae bacterium]
MSTVLGTVHAAVEVEERPATREHALPPVTEDPRYIGRNSELPLALRQPARAGPFRIAADVARV